jgi:hypothetical protein
MFYRQSTIDQQRTFRRHALDEQFKLFLFGNQVRHPPALYLADCFALNSPSAVSLLRARLAVDNHDLTVRDIAMLLATIDAMGTYDVAADNQLLRALNSQIAKMRNAGWRDSAEQIVAGIGHRRTRTSARGECA